MRASNRLRCLDSVSLASLKRLDFCSISAVLSREPEAEPGCDGCANPGWSGSGCFKFSGCFLALGQSFLGFIEQISDICRRNIGLVNDVRLPLYPWFDKVSIKSGHCGSVTMDIPGIGKQLPGCDCAVRLHRSSRQNCQDIMPSQKHRVRMHCSYCLSVEK